MKRLSEKFWMWLFIKATMKLGYAVLVMFNPEHDLDQEVKVIHIAKTEWDLVQSMEVFLEERKEHYYDA